MLKFIAVFFIGIVALLLGVVYFIGHYRFNPDYLISSAAGKDSVVRNLVVDTGKRDSTFYNLKIASDGTGEFTTNFANQGESLELAPEALQKVKDLINNTGIFNAMNLSRSFCLNPYQATLTLNRGWVSKYIDYANCNDDPQEIQTFRQRLYLLLNIDLPAEGS